jgi:hypothetical protein
MKKTAFQIVILLFAIQTLALHGQATERPKPGFSLSIEEAEVSPLSSGYPSDYHKLLVTYTNISNNDENYSNSDSAHALDMHVLLDGAPAQEREGMRELREERHPTKPAIRAPSVRSPTTIKPGKGFAFPLEISGYFDMTKPGTYTITVSKETYPNDPSKSATVWSNTITIVVPKPGTETPK